MTPREKARREFDDDGVIYVCGPPGTWKGDSGRRYHYSSDVWCPYCNAGLAVPLGRDGDDPGPDQDFRGRCLACGETFTLMYYMEPAFIASKRKEKG